MHNCFFFFLQSSSVSYGNKFASSLNVVSFYAAGVGMRTARRFVIAVCVGPQILPKTGSSFYGLLDGW